MIPVIDSFHTKFYSNGKVFKEWLVKEMSLPQFKKMMAATLGNGLDWWTDGWMDRWISTVIQIHCWTDQSSGCMMAQAAAAPHHFIQFPPSPMCPPLGVGGGQQSQGYLSKLYPFFSFPVPLLTSCWLSSTIHLKFQFHIKPETTALATSINRLYWLCTLSS